MAAPSDQAFHTPHAHETLEHAALARAFNTITAVAFAMCLAAVVSTLLTDRAFVLIPSTAAVVVGSLALAARRGHWRPASVSIAPILLALCMVAMVRRDGTHDAVAVVIAAVLVVGAVFLGRLALTVVTSLTVAGFLLIAYAEMTGQMQNAFSELTTARYALGVSLTYLATAMIVRTFTETLFVGIREGSQSEALLAVMMEASPAGTTITHLDDGTFVEANRAALEIFGRTREEVVGKSSLELNLWPPEARTELMSALQTTGKLKLVPSQVRRKDGEFRDLLISAALIEIAARKAVLLSAVDITELRRTEQSLRQSEERFAKIFQASPDAIGIGRLSDGKLLEANQRWLDLFGFERGELLAGSSVDLGIWVTARDRDRFVDQIRQQGSVRDYETQLRKKSGEIIDALISAEVIDIAGEPHIIAPVTDVTDRKRAEERIQQLATRDSLTGLPNRLLFTDRLTLAVSNAQRTGGTLALLFMDLDRFKTINDSLGHVIGDLFLKQVAERLSHMVRKGDTLARLGGDEFVVLLESIGPREGAADHVARKILSTLSEPFLVEGHTLACSCSIGISMYPSDATDPHGLIRNADMAMYAVKESGRGSYRYFSAELNARAQDRLHIENDLRDALALRQFETVYQPKVDVQTGEITGFEALLRWRHPALGLIAPGQFIAVAEETGLIVNIGRWVVEDVCRQVREWHRLGLPVRPVAVNLSVRELTPALATSVADLLRTLDVNPDFIEFEITESLFARNSEEVRGILGGLAEVGTRVTIDDFGTGYSSLSYIKRFSVAALKIDRSFVADLPGAPQDLAIVSAIITMARGLGIRVIAEGVETQEQLDALRALGCDEYQGYLFSRPVAAAEVERSLLGSA